MATFGGTTSTADADLNTYSIVVRAIETRRSGDTGPAQTTSQAVTVNVTNVDEPGVVTINWLQPEIDVTITATLEDPDSPDTPVPTDVSWEWTVSNVANPDMMNDDHWRDGQGTGGNTSAPYTPSEADTPDADFERFLRATVTYRDEESEAVEKTARAVSVKPVQDAGGGAENGSPDFEEELEKRTVREDALVGTRVGNAVAASVVPGSTAKDTQTYGLRAVIAVDLENIPQTDRPSIMFADHVSDPDDFSIDKATGQITVAGGLNFERVTPDGKYYLVVTVTDPSAASMNEDTAVVPTVYRGTDDVVVVITATDVNEAPVLAGRVELTINEIDGTNEDAVAPDFDGNTGADRATWTNYYTVSDEDDRDGIARWDLEGDDEALFRLVQVTGRTLEFNDPPNYENPLDADGDNVYKVTVVAYDNDGVAGKFDVYIAVGNVNEAGKVTFVDANGDPVEQPVSRSPVTAQISDPDGVVEWTVRWQWSKNPNPAAIRPAFMGDGPFPVSDDGFDDDTRPTVPTYTPNNLVDPDLMADVARFLRATAMYTDGADSVTSGSRTTSATTKHAVLAVMDLHRAPVFNPDTITLEIAEGSPTETYVGAPLPTATDPDGTDEDTTYELSGDGDGDIRYFELLSYDHDNNASTPMQLLLQVRVKPIDEANPVIDDDDLLTDDRPMIVFNHEDEDSNQYTIELTAIDATEDRALDATLTVNIVVTNRNEAPSEPTMAPEGLRIDGLETISYPEDGTGVVETYQITGPGAGDVTATWTLTGNDRSDFTLDQSTGELNFRATPDFENPADVDRDNTYEITVNAAIAGRDPLSMDVTVTVTEVMEPNRAPEFSATTAARSVVDGTAAGGNVGAPVTATDPDSGDTLTYALSGTDMASFTVDNMGQIMVGAGTMLDYETKASYMVTVTASDGIASDSIDVTVMVTAVGEMMGEVTLWDGMVALTMAPQVGDTITGAVMDPDVPVNVTAWQWAKTMDTADMNSWMDIQGATNAAYMVTEGDTGYYLRVMATYTDAVGTDTAMVYSMPTMMVTEMMGEVTLWAGMDALTMAPQVGDTITGAVMDPDGGVTGETWQWAKTKTPDMVESWMPITGATNAAYTVMEGDTGYHLWVMATYTDAVGTDTAMEYSMPTMMVGAEAGDPLFGYDTSGNGRIDKAELANAVFDYEINGTLEKPALADLVFSYEIGL